MEKAGQENENSRTDFNWLNCQRSLLGTMVFIAGVGISIIKIFALHIRVERDFHGYGNGVQ